MASLGETVAELLAKAQMTIDGAQGELGPPLSEVAGFGANPGGLKMWLYSPADLAPRSPLIVVLHGCGQTAAGYARGAGWIELADRHGFAVLCPEQIRANNPNLCFNWFEAQDIRRGAGEAESIAQMVRHAVGVGDFDARRVFVTGLSAGGAMAAVMLAAYPELFAAAAIIAGLPYGAAGSLAEAVGAMRRPPALSTKEWGDRVRGAGVTQRAGRWPRVAVWYGDADPTVTPASAEALVRQWCDLHGVSDVTPVWMPTSAARHAHAVWRGADGEVAVELHRISGLGHGTPIAAGGADGCGAPGPWVLEAGVSSSVEMARAWKLDLTRRSAAPRRPRATPASPDRRSRLPANEVAETIAGALRGAGLLR